MSLRFTGQLVNAGFNINMAIKQTQHVLHQSGNDCTYFQRCGELDFSSVGMEKVVKSMSSNFPSECTRSSFSGVSCVHLALVTYLLQKSNFSGLLKRIIDTRSTVTRSMTRVEKFA